MIVCVLLTSLGYFVQNANNKYYLIITVRMVRDQPCWLFMIITMIGPDILNCVNFLLWIKITLVILFWKK